MDSSPSRRQFLTALGAGAAAGLAGCSSGYAGDGGSGDGGTAGGSVADSPVTDSPGGPARDAAATPAPSRFTDVYEAFAPSVVRVRVVTGSGGAQGSGVVVDDRHVVTNQHVVAGAEQVTLVYRGGEYAEAEVVGTDVYSDLGVLRVDHPTEAPPREFVTGDPAIGTEVVAIGAPFGLAGSVSAGIVSGVDRSLPGPNDFRIPDAIQTDAAANPGNSGGPLVSLDGAALGVVNSGAGNDITFAISGALLNRVVPAIVADGSYDHAYMGVGLVSMTPALARANGLPDLRGVYVDEVFDDGPSAGVLRGSDGTDRAFGQQVGTGGDVLLALDDTPVPSTGDLGTYLALHTRPGDALSVTLLRDGQRRTVDLTLGERPAPN